MRYIILILLTLFITTCISQKQSAIKWSNVVVECNPDMFMNWYIHKAISKSLYDSIVNNITNVNEDGGWFYIREIGKFKVLDEYGQTFKQVYPN